MMLSAGIKGKQTWTVTLKNTAKALGSGGLEVFATPAMVALMENTAARSVESYLDEGWGTVGMSISVKHSAPTPVGMNVSCESTLTEVDGRRLVFGLQVSDENGIIGTGTHERFIINNEKFMQKVSAKNKA